MRGLLGLFDTRPKVSAYEHAKVLGQTREEFENIISAFITYNFNTIKETERQEAVIFSYILVWFGLIMSNADRRETQLAMAKFTLLVQVYKENTPMTRHKSVNILQTAITAYRNSTTLEAKDIPQAVMFLIFEFLERSKMDAVVRDKSSGFNEFHEVITEKIQLLITENDIFFEHFKLIK